MCVEVRGASRGCRAPAPPIGIASNIRSPAARGRLRGQKSSPSKATGAAGESGAGTCRRRDAGHRCRENGNGARVGDSCFLSSISALLYCILRRGMVLINSVGYCAATPLFFSLPLFIYAFLARRREFMAGPPRPLAGVKFYFK
jgi:hypothetical protein